MKSYRSGIINSIAVLVVMCATLAAPLSVSATSSSMGVNPRRDYTIKAGDKLNDTLDVSNLSKTDYLNITIQLIDFGAQDETGSPKLILSQTEPTRWSLKPYLTIVKSVHIAAGKSAEIPFTIAIPANVGAGSYYGAIKYSTSGDTSQNLSLTSSSATLLFVRVPGEAKDAMILDKFGAFTPSSDGKTGSFGALYVGSAPKYLSYRLINKGNVAEQPTGGIALKNVFGKRVKIIDKANPSSSTVLIDQTRRVDVCLNPEQTSRTDPSSGRNIEETKCNASGLTPGRYTAQLALVYGDNGSSSHELRSLISFWYLPIWFVVVCIIVLLAVIGAVALIVRKLRSRGKHGFQSRR